MSVLVLACSLLAPVAAHADSCAYNSVCPYQQSTVLASTGQFEEGGSAGVAVTPNGDIAVADAQNSSLLLYDSSGNLLHGVPMSGGGTNIAVDASTGDIYVVNDCVEVYSSALVSEGKGACVIDNNTTFVQGVAAGGGYLYVQVVDTSSDVWTSQIDVLSSAGTLERTIAPPDAEAGIAADTDGNVYVGNGSDIEEYDATGKLVNTLDLSGAPFAVDDGEIYDGIDVNRQWSISGYSSTTGTVITAGFTLPGGDQSWRPVGVGPQGIVGVRGNAVVSTYSPDGALQGSFDAIPTSDFEPQGAFEDAAGDLDIVDGVGAADDRILQLPAGGDELTTLTDLSSTFLLNSGGGSTALEPNGDIAVEGNSIPGDGPVSLELAVIDPAGEILRTFPIACGGCSTTFTIAPDGDLFFYTAESYAFGAATTIYEVSPDGSVLNSWPGPAAPPVQSFSSTLWPGLAITTDAAGNVYVDGVDPAIKIEERYGTAESCCDPDFTINKYSPSGTLLASWGADGGFEPLSAIWGLAVDSSGQVWMVANDGVHEYSPSGRMLAVWPGPFPAFFSADFPYTMGAGSSVSITPGGDILVTAVQYYASVPAGSLPTPAESLPAEVVEYSKLRDPLPPVPSADESPFIIYDFGINVGVGGASQYGANAVGTLIDCNSAGAWSDASGCTGSVSVSTTGEQPQTTRRTLLLGRKSFSIRLRHRERIKVRLTAKALRLLDQARRLTAKVVVSYHKRGGTMTGHKTEIVHLVARRSIIYTK